MTYYWGTFYRVALPKFSLVWALFSIPIPSSLGNRTPTYIWNQTFLILAFMQLSSLTKHTSHVLLISILIDVGVDPQISHRS